MIKIAPSLLAADFTKLAEEIKAIEEAGADVLHLDVMDGHFVPNLTFGLPIIKQIREITDMPLDVHLMVTNPEDYFQPLAEIGVQFISFHPETVYHLHRQISALKELKIKAGLALNPATPLTLLDAIFEDLDFVLLMSVNPGFGGQQFIPSSLTKLEQLNLMKLERNKELLIEIDGGVNSEKAALLTEIGVDILVAGSYVFKGDYKQRIKSLRV